MMTRPFKTRALFDRLSGKSAIWHNPHGYLPIRIIPSATGTGAIDQAYEKRPPGRALPMYHEDPAEAVKIAGTRLCIYDCTGNGGLVVGLIDLGQCDDHPDQNQLRT